MDRIIRRGKYWFNANLVNLINILVYSVIVYLYLGLSYPDVGHDYGQKIVRLLDTFLHYKINGLTIQWYSPTFGAGLPAYPNPLYLQYSLPQFLLFLFDPWISLNLSLLFYCAVGYLAFYKIGREVLEADWMPSSLGALLFISNGFIIEHAAAGHADFQCFALLSFTLYLLVSPKVSIMMASVLLGGTIGLLTHSFGHALFIIFTFSLLLALPIIYIINPGVIKSKQLISKITLGLVTGILLSGGKLYAVYSFMRFFPRVKYGVYIPELFGAMKGVVWHLVGLMTLTPLNLLRGKDSDWIVKSMKLATSKGDMWESDQSLSPILWMLLFLSLIHI